MNVTSGPPGTGTHLLYVIVRDTTCISYIKSFVCSQDGRGAYQTLHTELLGEEAINTQCFQVENKLAGMTLEAGKRRNWNFDNNTRLCIPLLLRGGTSTMTVSKPTFHQNETLPCLVLTSETVTWNPNITAYEQAKRAMLNPYGELKPPGDRNTRYNKTVINSVSHTTTLSIAALNSLQANMQYPSCKGTLCLIVLSLP